MQKKPLRLHSTKGLEYENVAIILGKDLDRTKACLRRFLRSMENQSIKFLLNMKKVEIFYMWLLLEQLKTCVFCTLMIWKRYGIAWKKFLERHMNFQME